jgi:hypothetical protein
MLPITNEIKQPTTQRSCRSTEINGGTLRSSVDEAELSRPRRRRKIMGSGYEMPQADGSERLRSLRKSPRLAKRATANSNFAGVDL